MLVGLAGFELPVWFIHRMIVSAIDIIVHCARLKGGVRKIVQVSELVGIEGDVVTMHDIFKFEQTGLDKELNAVGRFIATGIRPQCLKRLEVGGQTLHPGLFEKRELRFDRTSPLAYARQP